MARWARKSLWRKLPESAKPPGPEQHLKTSSQLFVFLAAVCCMSAATGIHESIFNNYLSDTFSLSANARGWLELPRETPGFLVVVMAGALATLPVMYLGALGALVMAVGVLGIALLGHSYWPMVAMMCIASAGAHLTHPVRASIVIALSEDHNRGKRMGQTGAVDRIGTILGAGLVWLTFDKAVPQYRFGFLCVVVLAGVAAVAYARIQMPSLHGARAPMVVRKRYWLYYALELFFGARKQVFLTFGPWVLIRVYGAHATSIAALLTLAAVIGIVFKPLAGVAIDRFGERVVLVADGVMLAAVCVGYGYALDITGDTRSALTLASACFIADNLLFALGTGRAIYLSRLTNSPQEITSTLAMGVSINHVVSMTIPAVGGAIWAGFGHERVFLGAAVLALATAALSSLVPGKGARHLAG